jgi:hypothetical protein
VISAHTLELPSESFHEEIYCGLNEVISILFGYMSDFMKLCLPIMNPNTVRMVLLETSAGISH